MEFEDVPLAELKNIPLVEFEDYVPLAEFEDVLLLVHDSAQTHL